MPDVTYHLQIDGAPGPYRGSGCFQKALHSAYDELVLGAKSVTVLRVEGPDNALEFSPLCTITPPEVKS